MGGPSVALAELYDGCKTEIEKRGGEVNLRMPVRGIHLGNGAVTGVEFDGGGRESAEAYVFALPHPTMAELADEEIRRLETLPGEFWENWEAPIKGVHFLF